MNQINSFFSPLRVLARVSRWGNQLVLGSMLALLPLSTLADPPATPPASPTADATVEEEHSWGHVLLWYLPNRVLDLLDVFRARVRVGPGFAVGARVTEPVSVYLGSYASVYAGLPGPRRGGAFVSPVGIETKSGIGLSLADISVEGGVGPDYSSTEVGVSLHALLVGVDIGFDPIELLDFVTNIIGIDLRDDDI